MANEITLQTNVHQVLKKDIRISIKTGEKNKLKKLGELRISQGMVDYIPSGNRVNYYTISWSRLAEAIKEYGKECKTTA